MAAFLYVTIARLQHIMYRLFNAVVLLLFYGRYTSVFHWMPSMAVDAVTGYGTPLTVHSEVLHCQRVVGVIVLVTLTELH